MSSGQKIGAAVAAALTVLAVTLSALGPAPDTSSTAPGGTSETPQP